MKIQRTVFKHPYKNNYMGYIATLWVIEAANITVSPLITAYKRNAVARMIWRT
jgi:hypothetical protein